MKKGVISNRQAISVMVLYLFGSSVILGSGGGAKSDAWIAVIIGTIISLPLLMFYSKLLKLHPGKDVYDLIIEAFGTYVGKLIILLFSWYSIHLGALVVRNFTEFIHIISLTNTPQFVIVIFMGLLCIYMVKSGIGVMGNWASLVLPFILLIIFTNILLAAKDFDLLNLRPILYNGLKPIVKPSFSVFTFPFGECVLFIFVLHCLNNKKQYRKVFLTSALIAGFVFLITSLRNILLLGNEYSSVLFFPAFGAVKLVNIADILERIEINVATVFLLSGLVKVSICFYVASKGVAKLFSFSDYQHIITPVALISLTLSCIIYESANEMVEWVDIYPYYAIPFQLILPIIMYFVIKIKLSSSKKNAKL